MKYFFAFLCLAFIAGLFLPRLTANRRKLLLLGFCLALAGAFFFFNKI